MPGDFTISLDILALQLYAVAAPPQRPRRPGAVRLSPLRPLAEDGCIPLERKPAERLRTVEPASCSSPASPATSGWLL